jgi:hypothetical protein
MSPQARILAFDLWVMTLNKLCLAFSIFNQFNQLMSYFTDDVQGWAYFGARGLSPMKDSGSAHNLVA